MRDLSQVERQLASRDPEERRHALHQLAGDDSEPAVHLLFRALGDVDWRVRKEATAVAVAMAPAPAVLRRLVEALGPDEDDVGLRNAAVEALAGYGIASVDALSVALPALDADGRKLAAEALGRTGQTAALLLLGSMASDPDPNVRAAVVEAVAGLGATCVDDATPLLERFLNDRDPLLKLTALNGLNDLGVFVPWQHVERMVGEPALKGAALIAAGRSGHPDAARIIATALGSSRGALWFAALSAMVAYVRGGPEAVANARISLGALPEDVRRRLLEQADRPDDSVDERKMALMVAAAAGMPEAAAVAARALTDDRVAAEAEEALVLLGPAGVEALVDSIESGQHEERALMIEVLARLTDGSTASLAARAVRAALSDPSADVVAAALDALPWVGDELCVGPAAALLRSDSPRVRRAAAAALGAIARRYPNAAIQLARAARPDELEAQLAAVVIGALDEPVLGSVQEDIAFLSQTLAHGDARARRFALEALMRSPHAQAVEVVAFALTDEEADVRRAAVKALGKVRTAEGAAPGLRHLLDLVSRTADDSLAIDAVRALGDAGDDRAQEVLLSLVRDGIPVVAVAAIEALSELPGPIRVSALSLGLAHSDSEVVKASLQHVEQERHPAVVQGLLRCLSHPGWDVRRLAADLLGQIGGNGAIAALRERLASEVEPLVRDAIQRALLELEARAAGIRRTTPAPPRRSGSSRAR
ncbi:HEAT repeat domain-containing protein [Myxococcota bacterium]